MSTRRLSNVVRLALVALFAWGIPVAAQSPTPRERAESFTQQARESVTDRDRARLLYLALAEWYEEGARAVLTMDYDRLAHAVREESASLFAAYQEHGNNCPEKTVVFLPHPVSYLAYVIGLWDGQGGSSTRLANQAELATALLDAAEYRRRNARDLCVP